MMIDGSIPVMPGGEPLVLLTMMTPMAPASCAFFTFDTKGKRAAIDHLILPPTRRHC